MTFRQKTVLSASWPFTFQLMFVENARSVSRPNGVNTWTFVVVKPLPGPGFHEPLMMSVERVDGRDVS